MPRGYFLVALHFVDGHDSDDGSRFVLVLRALLPPNRMGSAAPILTRSLWTHARHAGSFGKWCLPTVKSCTTIWYSSRLVGRFAPSAAGRFLLSFFYYHPPIFSHILGGYLGTPSEHLGVWLLLISIPQAMLGGHGGHLYQIVVQLNPEPPMRYYAKKHLCF